MPIRHAEWRVRSNQVIKFSSYTRAERSLSSSPKLTAKSASFKKPLNLARRRLILR